MILGTVFAGWWGWQYGPWMALLGGVVGGMLGGLLLGVATTTFGVNHIVAGFADQHPRPRRRPVHGQRAVRRRAGRLAHELARRRRATWASSRCRSCRAGGSSAWGTPDPLGRIDDWRWFVSPTSPDSSGRHHRRPLRRAARRSACSSLSGYVLWHTPFGLRLRSAGERPSAADSLGVRVHLYRYIGVGDLGRAGRHRRGDARAARRPLQPGTDGRQGLPRPRHAGRRQLAAVRRGRRRRAVRLLRRASRSGSTPSSCVLGRRARRGAAAARRHWCTWSSRSGATAMVRLLALRAGAFGVFVVLQALVLRASAAERLAASVAVARRRRCWRSPWPARGRRARSADAVGHDHGDGRGRPPCSSTSASTRSPTSSCRCSRTSSRSSSCRRAARRCVLRRRPASRGSRASSSCHGASARRARR